MKSKDVSLGQVYVVKVSGKLTRVRLDSESPYGGWVGTNLQTKHQVRIKTAAKLRSEVKKIKIEFGKRYKAVDYRGVLLPDVFTPFEKVGDGWYVCTNSLGGHVHIKESEFQEEVGLR